jgi:hypothetical protein
VAVFKSLAKSSGGEPVEDQLWQVTLYYEMDPINLKATPGSRFRFAAVDYKIKLLEDKTKK